MMMGALLFHRRRRDGREHRGPTQRQLAAERIQDALGGVVRRGLIGEDRVLRGLAQSLRDALVGTVHRHAVQPLQAERMQIRQSRCRMLRGDLGDRDDPRPRRILAVRRRRCRDRPQAERADAGTSRMHEPIALRGALERMRLQRSMDARFDVAGHCSSHVRLCWLAHRIAVPRRSMLRPQTLYSARRMRP